MSVVDLLKQLISFPVLVQLLMVIIGEVLVLATGYVIGRSVQWRLDKKEIQEISDEIERMIIEKWKATDEQKKE